MTIYKIFNVGKTTLLKSGVGPHDNSKTQSFQSYDS